MQNKVVHILTTVSHAGFESHESTPHKEHPTTKQRQRVQDNLGYRITYSTQTLMPKLPPHTSDRRDIP